MHIERTVVGQYDQLAVRRPDAACFFLQAMLLIWQAPTLEEQQEDTNYVPPGDVDAQEDPEENVASDHEEPHVQVVQVY